MRTTNNKRNTVLSFAVTENELKAFKKLHREAEDMNDIRFTISEFIRCHMFLPYIECHSIPDKTKEDPPSLLDSKPPTEHRAYPVI